MIYGIYLKKSFKCRFYPQTRFVSLNIDTFPIIPCNKKHILFKTLKCQFHTIFKSRGYFGCLKIFSIDNKNPFLFMCFNPLKDIIGEILKWLVLSSITDLKKWDRLTPCSLVNLITCHLCNCPSLIPVGLHSIIAVNGFQTARIMV